MADSKNGIPKGALYAMKLSQGIFSIKLYELEQQYAEMLSRLQICQQEDHQKLSAELQRVKDEYRSKELVLQNSIKNSRSKAVATLSDAQLHYLHQAREILQRELPEYLHSEGSSRIEDQAEAASLYAEYAVDFAAQSARYALIAAMTAIDLQMTLEEQTGGKPS